MAPKEDNAFRCVLSGEIVKTLGSKKEAEEGKVDGISTDIGIISRNVLRKYREILAESRLSKSGLRPSRKRMIEQIDGVPSLRAHQLGFESGKAGIPPFPPEDYFRTSQFPKKTKAPSA